MKKMKLGTRRRQAQRQATWAAALVTATALVCATPANAAPITSPGLEIERYPDLPNLPGWQPIPTIPGVTDALPDPTKPPVLHEGAPVPVAFDPTLIARSYSSDLATDKWLYMYVVDPFTELQRNHPEVMEQNLETVVRINNDAKMDQEQIDLALADDHDDPLLNMSVALGADLGRHLQEAFDENRLPKTRVLLSGNLARGGMLVSSTFIEKYIYNYDRPFVVAPERIERYYRNAPGDDDPYTATPSYPSGHTNNATWKATLLGLMLPEVAPQLQARASDAGHSRLVMGVHYPLDVMGGRMMGNQAAADRWADPEFRPLIEAARDELRAELEWRCGATIAECVAADTQYLSDAEAVQRYTERMTYDFEQIGASGQPLTVPRRYAGLLEARFPQLTESQRIQVLAQTAIDSGYPLDRSDTEGNHIRINMAAALAAQVSVNADGTVNVVVPS